MTTRTERRKAYRRSLHRFRNRLNLSFLFALWTYSLEMLLAPPQGRGFNFEILWRVPLYQVVWLFVIECCYCEYELRRIEREIEEEEKWAR